MTPGGAPGRRPAGVALTDRARTGQLSCLLVGLGDRAQRVLVPALAECGVRITDVADPSAQRLGALRRAQAAGQVAPGARLLPDLPPRVDRYDLAVVAVPHGAHEEVARTLTATGCPVLKEKPYARSLDEAVRLHRHAGALLYPLVDRPHLPVFRLLTRLLPGLGSPVRFHARYWRPRVDYRHTWRNDPRTAGDGVLLDMGYHCLDVLFRLFGYPRTLAVTSTWRRPGYLVDERVRLSCEFPMGSRGILDVSRLADEACEEYTFAGAHGLIRASLTQLDLRRPDGVRRRWRFAYDPVSAATRTFRRAVAELPAGERIQQENRHGLRVMAAVDAAYRGRPAILRPREEDTGGQ